MRRLQWTAFALWLTMTAGLSYGLTFGAFWDEGGIITDLIWGNLTLLDFYVGIAFAAIWVAFRESSPVRAFFWIVLLIGLGNWSLSLYVFLAARATPEGDWQRFFLGHRSPVDGG